MMPCVPSLKITNFLLGELVSNGNNVSAMYGGVSASHSARINKVVFGAWDEKVGASGSLYDLVRDKRLGTEIEVISGVLETEASDQLKEFFDKKR